MAKTLTQIIDEALETAPDLVGTPKQIAWADQLVEKFIDEASGLLRHLVAATRRGEPGASWEDVQRGIKRFKQILRQEQASWWINHRDDDTGYLLFDALQGELVN